MPSPPNVTLADVAARAGVHAATVSRAISRPDLLNPATLQRVTAAVDALGYVPNRAARHLAGGRTSTLALVVPDITNPFFSQFVRSAQRHARTSGHLMLLADTAGDPRTEVEAVRSLAGNVDGLVVCSPTCRSGALSEAASGRPLVLVNRMARGLASVTVDQEQIVDLTIDHLRSLGHRRIVVAAGPPRYWSSTRRERHARSHPGRPAVIDGVPPTFDGGGELLARTLARRATAVAAFNDMMALGLLAAASDRGVEIPGQLSVVGSDDVALAAMSTPALTTVAAPFDDMAVAAIEQLWAQLDGRPPAHVVFQPSLVVRASTSSPEVAR